MSGPKRGRIVFEIYQYDTTEIRINDLETASAKLQNWLHKQSRFIIKYLGNEALEQAQQTYQRVLDCIRDRLPDEGFDSYGQAWQLFNRLWRKAVRVKNERKKQLQQAAREIELIVKECHEMWNDEDSQMLMKRWITEEEQEELGYYLRFLRDRRPIESQRKVRGWQEKFQMAIEKAQILAEKNSKRIAIIIPEIKESLESLSSVNLALLSPEEKHEKDLLIKSLRLRADISIADENPEELQDLLGEMKSLSSALNEKVTSREDELVYRAWEGALKKLGYKVKIRQDEKTGERIIEASALPASTLTATFKKDSQEVALNVNGEYDHTQCVNDINSIQQALSSFGARLDMTDWGRANPALKSYQKQTLTKGY